MSGFNSSRLISLSLFLFVALFFGSSILHSQETQSNKLPEKKEAAGILSKDQAVIGPAWVYRLIPTPDSSRTFIIKDTKGNEVKITTKDFDFHREPLYIPAGHSLSVDKGSFYWYGATLDKRY